MKVIYPVLFYEEKAVGRICWRLFFFWCTQMQRFVVEYSLYLCVTKEALYGKAYRSSPEVTAGP